MTELIIIRHAITVDKDEYAQLNKDDKLRPLSKEGEKKFYKMAKALKKIEPNIDCFYSSPLLRATQTLQIILPLFKNAKDIQTVSLAPEKSPPEIITELAGLKGKVVALIGHEPYLSVLTSWLLCKQLAPFVKFKKGGLLKIDFDNEVEAGKGSLAWYLTPGTALRILSQ